MAERGLPQSIRCDNGPELTSRHMLAWCVERQIGLHNIEPGKPTQNGRLESFNGHLREECLNVSWFENLFDARRKLAVWRKEYNEERPHSSLGYLTPAEFSRQWSASPSGTPSSAATDRRQGDPAGSLRSALTPVPRCAEELHHEGEAKEKAEL